MSLCDYASLLRAIGGFHIGPGSAPEIPTVRCTPVGNFEQTFTDGTRDDLFLFCILRGLSAHPSFNGVMFVLYVAYQPELGLYSPSRTPMPEGHVTHGMYMSVLLRLYSPQVEPLMLVLLAR